ncbi:MAG: N-acetylmuramoyl-L-alanine amidase, partial [Marmoricola sp.]|nr:N-acetylmuramoyl-L-alanine amidase [Marmoricola sp.]
MNAVFRLGDSGPAVAQIIGLLQRIGVLGDSAAETAYDEDALGEALYDERVELA